MTPRARRMFQPFHGLAPMPVLSTESPPLYDMRGGLLQEFRSVMVAVIFNASFSRDFALG